MGTFYLVRYGQASFGAEDSDNLSALGQQQSVRRGDWCLGHRVEDAFISGLEMALAII